jgi:hypothetical protein
VSHCLSGALVMASSFVKAMDGEISALEAELADDPRYQKLQDLRRLRQRYMEGNLSPAPARAEAQKTGRRASPARQAIIDMAVEIIRQRSLLQHGPLSTSDLLAMLEQRQVIVAGKNPRNNLSAILSASKKFEPHGRAGWTLVATAPENTETADLPSQDTSAVSAEPRLTSEGTSEPVNPWPGGGT